MNNDNPLRTGGCGVRGLLNGQNVLSVTKVICRWSFTHCYLMPGKKIETWLLSPGSR